jgi:hypothetical protein
LKACIASIAGETSTLLGMRKIIIGTDGITPFGKKGGKKGMTKVYSELSSHKTPKATEAITNHSSSTTEMKLYIPIVFMDAASPALASLRGSTVRCPNEEAGPTKWPRLSTDAGGNKVNAQSFFHLVLLNASGHLAKMSKRWAIIWLRSSKFRLLRKKQ